MSTHMVIFQTPDGNPGYNQFESVGEAVAFVETLRNDQGIENARMFALEEIKFDLKPYFKVELQALTPGTAASSPAPAPAAQPAPAAAAPAPTPSQPAPTPAPSDTSSFGTFAPSSPAPSAAPASDGPESEPSPSASPTSPGAPGAPSTPPADRPVGGDQPTRRGLFGR